MTTRSPVVATLLLAGAAVYPASAQKVPDVRVDNAPAGIVSTDPEIAAAGDSVYVVWEDRRNGGLDDVWFNRSDDRGGTWQSSDTQINTDTGALGSKDPQIAASGTDVYVAYDGDGGVRFNRSTDGGVSWAATDTLISSLAANPLIVANGTSVYIAYQKITTAPFFNDLYVRQSLDGGATWQTETRVDTDTAGAGDSVDHRIAVAGTSVYVAWRDKRNGLADVYFNRSLDSGATWLAADVRLDTGVAAGTVEAYFSVELAAAGTNVYVIWWDDRNAPGLIQRDVFVNNSQDSGTTWRPAGLRLDTDVPGAAESHFPHIAATGSSAWVVWAEFRNGDGDVYLSQTSDGGSTWSAADVRIDNAPAGVHSGVLEIAASGSTVVIGFQDNRTGGINLFSNRSVDGGATWLPVDVRLPPATGVVGASLQGIAISGSSVYIAWDDSRGGDCDIHMNIPFGIQPYGFGKAGTGGFVPAIAGSGLAAIGETVSLDISGALGGAGAGLLIGGPGTRTVLPLLGGTLWLIPQLAPAFAVGGTSGVPGAGSISLPLGLPSDASLVGIVLYFQPVFLDPGVSAGVSMANAVEVWIG